MDNKPGVLWVGQEKHLMPEADGSEVAGWPCRFVFAKPGTDWARLFEQVMPAAVVVDADSLVDPVSELMALRRELSQSAQLLVLSAHAQGDEREAWFSLGAMDVLPKPLLPLELMSKLRDWTAWLFERKRLKQQFDEAGEMALMAMSMSSDLGAVVEFLTSSLTFDSLDAMEARLMEAGERLGLNLAVMLVLESPSFGFSTWLEDTELCKVRLLEARSGERIVRIAGCIQVNYPHISVLAEGFPEDDQMRAGRLTDTLAILTQAAESAIERRLTEARAREAGQVRSAFIATMSHELRTPLNAILGFSRHLAGLREGASISPRDLKALESITRNADHLHGLIERLVDLARAASGGMRLTFTQTDLAALVDSMVPAVADRARLKGLAFNWVAPTEAITLQADVVRMRAVVAALLDNAVKFTDRGAIEVSLAASDHERLKACACLRIKDSGVGLSAEDCSTLFEEIGPLDIRVNRRYQGSGTGLAHAAMLVGLHGGAIEVNSAPGKGSCFSVWLPLAANPVA